MPSNGGCVPPRATSPVAMLATTFCSGVVSIARRSCRAWRSSQYSLNWASVRSARRFTRRTILTIADLCTIDRLASSPGRDGAPAGDFLPAKKRHGKTYPGRVDPPPRPEGVRGHEDAHPGDAVIKACRPPERAYRIPHHRRGDEPDSRDRQRNVHGDRHWIALQEEGARKHEQERDHEQGPAEGHRHPAGPVRIRAARFAATKA